ncbi:MAG: aldo/keto reductase [Thermoleophilia bacterium]
MQRTVLLNNDVEMPRLGLGTYLSRGEQAVRAVKWALAAGYRLIDTSLAYGNEREVAEGLRRSGVPRDEVFLTSKLENDDHGYEQTLRAVDRTLANLGTEYLDLYLVHWPVPGLRDETWRAMETLYEAGKARAIGVSNYTVRHLEEMADYARVTPAVNQCELHPFLYQLDLVRYCRQAGIQFESYSPLAKARRLDDPTLNEIGRIHGRTAAQVMLRWHLQHGLVAIPKSVHRDHIEENWGTWEFELSASEMALIDRLDEGRHLDWDPDTEA